MKSMIKFISLVVLLPLLLSGMHGAAYCYNAAEVEDFSKYIFELPANPDVLTINDPHHYANNFVSEPNSAQNSSRLVNIPDIIVNGIQYEFETYVQTQGFVDVPAYTTTEELTPDRIAAYISMAQIYPGVEILGNPTEDYNCHSYAWYLEATNNPYWIVDVAKYTDDVHTAWRMNTEPPQPGDICIYLRSGTIVHSAVVVSFDGVTTICRSKWGPSVLCEHPLGSVPAEYLDTDGVARYYIMSITPHEWSYESAGTNQHTRTCTICSYEETLSCEYEYTYFYDDMHNASCKYCSNGYSGVFCTFEHISNGDGTHTDTCIACGNENTYDCNNTTIYVDDGRHFSGCSQCGAGSYHDCSDMYIHYEDEAGDWHKYACAVCGHESSSDAEACTFDYVYYGVVDDSNAHVYACTICGHVDSGPAACLCIGVNPCALCGHVNDYISLGIEEEELVE